MLSKTERSNFIGYEKGKLSRVWYRYDEKKRKYYCYWILELAKVSLAFTFAARLDHGNFSGVFFSKFGCVPPPADGVSTKVCAEKALRLFNMMLMRNEVTPVWALHVGDGM